MWESPTAEFANKEYGEGKKTRLERAGESLRERDLQLSLSPRDCVLLVGSQSEGIVVSCSTRFVSESRGDWLVSSCTCNCVPGGGHG